MKENRKRSSNWGVNNFTRRESYYPVADDRPKSLTTIPPLKSRNAPLQEQTIMRDWAREFAPWRQRTVRGETTKDKAGTLPVALYAAKDVEQLNTVSISPRLGKSCLKTLTRVMKGVVCLVKTRI